MIQSQNLKAIAQILRFESSAMWALRCVIYSFVYKGIPCLEVVKTLRTR